MEDCWDVVGYMFDFGCVIGLFRFDFGSVFDTFWTLFVSFCLFFVSFLTLFHLFSPLLTLLTPFSLLFLSTQLYWPSLCDERRKNRSRNAPQALQYARHCTK